MIVVPALITLDASEGGLRGESALCLVGLALWLAGIVESAILGSTTSSDAAAAAVPGEHALATLHGLTAIAVEGWPQTERLIQALTDAGCKLLSTIASAPFSQLVLVQVGVFVCLRGTCTIGEAYFACFGSISHLAASSDTQNCSLLLHSIPDASWSRHRNPWELQLERAISSAESARCCL